MAKLGHFGTLDPFAEGVLLLGFSGASRLSDYVHKYLPKTYRARGKWGAKTNTGDRLGEVVEKRRVALPIASEGERLLGERFSGKEYWQKPPHFSSAKHRGRPLYRYAREGILIEKEAVARTVHFLGEFEWRENHLDFTCCVSAGTYVRVLFEDMAESLGNLGHLEKLVRRSIGPCHEQNALRRDEWKLAPEELLSRGWGLERILPLDGLYLDGREGKRFQEGAKVKVFDQAYRENPDQVCSGFCWVYGDGGLLGLARKAAEGPVTCFNLRH